MADAALPRAKQPAEEFVVEWDFADDLAPGDSVKPVGAGPSDSSVTAKQVDTGADVTATLLEGATAEANKLKAQVQGGTAGKDYDVTFSAATTNGDRFNRIVRVRVRS